MTQFPSFKIGWQGRNENIGRASAPAETCKHKKKVWREQERDEAFEAQVNRHPNLLHFERLHLWWQVKTVLPAD